MRIAYLSADYGIPVLGGKGGSVHIRELIAALVAEGHEVTLYCTRLGDGALARIPARIVEVAKPAGSQAMTINAGNGAQPEMSERLTKERGWMARARALERQVIADHDERPFDMVYERYSLWSRAGVRIAQRTGLPLTVEVNAPLLSEAQAYREIAAIDDARAIESDVLTNADAIIAVSEGVKSYCVEGGARPERVHVVPNAVDTKAFSPETPPAAVPGRGAGPVIGFVGGLKPWHGLQELLAAFRNISVQHPDARLLIVGDGPMRGWIEGFAAGTDLAERIHITGWVAHADLPSLITAIDIATAPYPKLDSFYFSPLKLFEYMAAGRSIVASRIGQIDTIVEDGANGLLVAPGDVDELTNALDRLLHDSGLRAAIGESARNTAARYTWRQNARRIAGLAGVCDTCETRRGTGEELAR